MELMVQSSEKYFFFLTRTNIQLSLSFGCRKQKCGQTKLRHGIQIQTGYCHTYNTIMLFRCKDSSQLFRVDFIYCKSIEVDINFSGHQVQSELRCCQTLADLNHTYLFEDPPLFAALEMELFTDLSLNEQVWLMQQTGVLHHKLHCHYHLPPNYPSPGYAFPSLHADDN